MEDQLIGKVSLCGPSLMDDQLIRALTCGQVVAFEGHTGRSHLQGPKINRGTTNVNDGGDVQ